jgi:hypothetical protein
LEEAAGVLVQVPMLPVPPCILSPLLQLLTVTDVGLGLDEVAAGVYTYEQVHFDVVVVEPATVEVKVCTVPAMTVAAVGVTVSVTTLAPEPPQPLCHSNAAASISIAAVWIVYDFITDVSPMFTRASPRPLF